VKIQALSTGTVRIKTAMARGRGSALPSRLARTLLDRQFTGELPIHAWLIEHPQGPILVDTGERSETTDLPIARFAVTRDQEIDRQLALHDVRPEDLAQVVLTHLHGDHMNGLARLPGVAVLASAEALRGGARRLRRLGAAARPLSLTDEPFGAFARSAALTADGSVIAVPVPGHARGQIAVIVVEEDHHVLLAGDSAYSQQQLLDLQPDGVSLSARRAVESMRTILEHARRHPTVFLPSHDPGAEARLAGREPLPS
jgi:glyoxylase-like metal-dependent hydrolase (beta-lactamase superfamily II)